MADLHRVTVTVNGERLEHYVPARMLLSDFLRDVVGLTGTHVRVRAGSLRIVHGPARR